MFDVEIVFALPEKQSLRIVTVNSGTTVAETVALSALAAEFPSYELPEMSIGIWGRKVDGDQVVKEGDRIEIYRQLEMDPREARRQLALAGRTMNKPNQIKE